MADEKDKTTPPEAAKSLTAVASAADASGETPAQDNGSGVPSDPDDPGGVGTGGGGVGAAGGGGVGTGGGGVGS